MRQDAAGKPTEDHLTHAAVAVATHHKHVRVYFACGFQQHIHGQPIAKATSQTYTLVVADVGDTNAKPKWSDPHACFLLPAGLTIIGSDSEGSTSPMWLATPTGAP